MEQEKTIYYDDMVVGREFKPYEYTMTKETIRKYAEAIADKNPLYNDEEAAKESPYGSIIAPPTSAAIYSISAYKTEGKTPPGGIHARQKFEFVKPVLPGDRLEIIARVKDKFIKKERKYVILDVTTTNQKGEVVVRSEMTAIWSQ